MPSNPVYDFVLNGLDLTANTTRIQLHKRNMNAYNHVLRQSTPTGARSGRSTFIISAEMAFPNTNEINNKLRYLIAHFKVSPFAQLISRYASNAAFSDETVSANLAVTLSNLSVYTVPDAPEALFANFDMTIFNYHPYSPDFNFKNELSGPRRDLKNKYEKVSDPTKSSIYQKSFEQVLKNVPQIGIANHDTTIVYNNYLRETPPSSKGVSDKDISNIGQSLFYAHSDDARILGTNPKMHRNAVGTFKHLARVYRRKFGTRMVVSNMFLPATGIDFYNDEVEEDVLDDHRAGLAFDLALYELDSDGIGALKKKYLDDKNYKSFIEIAKDNSFVAHNDKPWHFSYTGSLGKKNKEDIIRENHSVGKDKNILDKSDYVKIMTDFLQQKKSDGYFQTNISNIWKKEVSETIIEGNDKLAVTSINVSLTHNITSIPIVGYEYPTTQYMGGKHTKAIFALEGLRHDQIDNIKLALNTAHNNENNFKRVRDYNVLTIVNPITKLFGLQHCITDSTESSTVPGNPDMDIFVFSATEYDPWFRESIVQEDVKGSSEIKKKAFTLINKHLEYGPIHELIGQQETEGYGGNKDSMVNTFMENIHAFWDPNTRQTGVNSSYGPTETNYSPVLDAHINNIVGILNDFISDKDVHKEYVNKIGDVYGLSAIVKGSIESRKPKIVARRNPSSYDKPGLLAGWVEPLEYVEDDAINIDVISRMYDNLSSEFWSMFGDGIFELKQFKSVAKEMDKLTKQSLTQCYKDLNLPATISSDPIDTDPDYFFWSEDNDTTYFKDAYNDAKKYVKESIGIAAELEETPYSKEWQFADVFSKSSAENGNKRPYNANDSSDTFEISEEIMKSHDFDSSSLERMLNKLVEQSLDDKVFTMNRAYPTYKVYFVEEDEGEEFNIIPRLSFDDFFGYNAVYDIKIVRSRKVPADLCILTMSNLSQKLTGSKKYNNDDLDKFYETRRADRDSFAENPIDALVLRPGQRIQVRLGYSNNPEQLDIVFNGQIVEVGGTHAVTVVCQSYATELVSHVKGIEEPEEIRKASDKVTGGILANLMQSSEVAHFGSRKRSIISNLAFKDREDRESAGNSLYGPNLDPRDDNIFPPDIGSYITNSTLLDPGGTSWDINLWGGVRDTIKDGVIGFLSGIGPTRVATAAIGAAIGSTSFVEKYVNLDYKLFHTTIWDVFKEMELRHPGWVASPTVYGNRMSMFFGVPDMGHWSRPETLEEYRENAPIRKDAGGPGILTTALTQNKYGVPFRQDVQGDPDRFFFSVGGVDQESVDIKKSLARDRFLPFRKHHYLADKINIISNDIKVNSDVYNAVTVQYVDDVDSIDDYGNVNYETGNTKTLKVDADLKDEDTNLLFSQQPNCEGEFMAVRYAQGLLLRHLKDVYTGSITVLGNPKIKPYDTCHVFDDIADMYGPVEVEQVVHHFSHETGFITEIVPDLCVSGNQYSTLTLTQAMGEMSYIKYAGAAALTARGIAAGKKFGPSIIGKIVGSEKSPIFTKAGAKAGLTGLKDYAAVKAYTAIQGAEEGIDKFSKASKAAGVRTAVAETAYTGASKLKESTSSLLNKVTNLKTRAGDTARLRSGFKGLLTLGAGMVGKTGWLAAGAFILYGIGSIYITKTQERQPILIKPLVVNKVPFIAGIEGFRQNTLYSAYMERFGLAMDNVGDMWEDMKEGLEDIFLEIVE